MILNIGCGKEVYGDIRADICRSIATHVICDAHFLPFKDDTFDEVYSKNLFEHLRNPLNALREQKRVLRPQGKIVLITDHASYWHHHIRNKSLHIRYARKGKFDRHYAIYLPEHLLNFFDALRMHVVELSYVGYGYKLGGITGLINRLLTLHQFLKYLAYPRLKVVALKDQMKDLQRKVTYS